MSDKIQIKIITALSTIAQDMYSVTKSITDIPYDIPMNNFMIMYGLSLTKLYDRS